jgi:hypothetical protein
MTAKQKFKRGDVVHIAADLGSAMSHFPSDEDAIVMGSYRDQCGGNDVDSYTLMFLDTGGECSWYYTNQLTLLHHGGEEAIAKVESDRDAREKVEADLAWIVANWNSIRTNVSGASIGELMRRIGITNPWGANGEGIDYYANAYATFHLLDPILSTGSLELVEKFLDSKTLKKYQSNP